MRLLRLGLNRYGHLSDVVLELPADRGLHVVLGANEAGKSTALAAIRDGLFGFGHRSPYGFQHALGDLRVLLTLADAAGQQATFVRRKASKGDLRNAAGDVLPEAAIAAFLGGITRERFARGFGLDAAELRAGGEAILSGAGDVGETLLQAQTGLSGFRSLAERLERDAGKLFGDRRGERAFHTAARTYTEAKQSLQERSLDSADYRRARDEQARLLAERAANAAAAERLAAERAKLQRIHATAPARTALAEALAARAALGDIPSLPDDAEARRQHAVMARETASRSRRSDAERDASALAELATLVADPDVLAQAPAIDSLAADLNRISAAGLDRDKRRLVAAQHAREVEATGRRLGLEGDAAALAARIPDTLRREAATRAITRHVALTARLASAEKALAETGQEHEAAQAALAQAEAPVDFAALRSAIDAARAEGRLDAEHRAAERTVQTTRTELAEAMRALPLWQGDAETLAAAPVPLDAAITTATRLLTDAAETLRQHEAALAQHDAARADLDADLKALTEAGALPTEEAIAAVRDRRDHAWRRLRAIAVDATAEGVEGELAALSDRFEAMSHDADALADRRATDAARVERFRHLTGQRVRTDALRDRAAAARDAAAATHAAAGAAWQALWQPTGLLAEAPAAMREWRQRRDDALIKRRAAVAAALALEAIAARCDATRMLLNAHLPATIAADAGSIGELLRRAELTCTAGEATARTYADRRSSAVTAATALTKAVRARDAVLAELTQWRGEWQAAAQGIGLSHDAAPEAGKPALDLWTALDTHARDWHQATSRIAEMTEAISGFDAKVAALTSGMAPDLAAAAPQEAVRRLAARLAEARAAEAKRRDLLGERERLRLALDRATREAEAAEAALAALHALAGTTDDAALQAAIIRAGDHASRSREIAQRQSELTTLGAGRTLAALAAEAEGIDTDRIDGSLAAIEAQLRDMETQNLSGAARLAELRQALRLMEDGHDAAGAAQAMQDALAEMADVAGRYARLRLAHSLLRAGIERFRRQQQDPLLGRAGRLFERLTEGRYDRLDADEPEDGKRVILALRPDGSSCPVERLSEGTRDQLFLALRLAAIESGGAGMPFIADDLLVNFDDRRARAALRVLAEFGATTQTILFTHHAHIAELAAPHAAVLALQPAPVAA